MNWSTDSAKQLFLICDAPGHGKDIWDGHDNHPKGSPDGVKIQDQMKEFARRHSNFSVIRLDEDDDRSDKGVRDCCKFHPKRSCRRKESCGEERAFVGHQKIRDRLMVIAECLPYCEGDRRQKNNS